MLSTIIDMRRERIREGMELICVESDSSELPPGTILTIDSSVVSGIYPITVLGGGVGIFTITWESSGGLLIGIILISTTPVIANIAARRLSDFSDVDVFTIKLSGRLPE